MIPAAARVTDALEALLRGFTMTASNVDTKTPAGLLNADDSAIRGAGRHSSIASHDRETLSKSCLLTWFNNTWFLYLKQLRVNVDSGHVDW